MASLDPKHIIAPANGQKTVLFLDGNTSDIITAIYYGDSESKKYILPGAERLRGRTDYETLKNIFYFVMCNINFKADGRKEQVIRSPGYLFQTRTGDCKSYSIAIGAICRALGIPYRYRFVSWRAGNYEHVYPIATINGNDVIMDAVYGHFNKEARYYKYTDRKPTNGISGIGSFLTDSFWIVVMLGIIFLLVFKPIKMADIKKLPSKFKKRK